MRRAGVGTVAAVALAVVAVVGHVARDSARDQRADRRADRARPPETAGRPAGAAAEDAEAHRTSGWTLHVVDPGDVPLPGVLLVANEVSSVVTDPDGIARVEAAGASLEVAAPAWSLRWTVAERHARLVIPDGVPVRVAFADGRTGAPLEGGLRVLEAFDVVGDRVTVSRSGDTPSMVTIVPPDGFAAYGVARHGLDRGLCRYAARGRSVVPLWPATRARLRVVDGGEPRPGRDVQATVNGVIVERAKTGADGWASFRAIPDVAGTRLGFRTRLDRTLREDVPAGVRLTGAGAYPDAVHDLNTQLPPLPGRNEIFGIGGDREETVAAKGRGSVAVEARRRSGAPAADALVRCTGRRGREHVRKETRADAQGRAAFDGLPEFPCTVAVVEPGFVHVAKNVTPLAGETVRVRLDEPDGWSVRVQVVDAEGRPVPFATVSVRVPHGFHAFLDDRGEQLLTPYTDANGLIEIGRLPAPPVTVFAASGSVGGHVDLDGPVPSIVLELSGS